MSGFETLLAGRTLSGRYRIEQLMARGGMGAVYRAVDERLGRSVAVKVMDARSWGGEVPDDELRKRFHREARAAAALHHPNLVTVHDFGTDPELDLDFLVMELLAGDDLARRLRREGPPPLGLALHVLREAARGLAAGHRAGLIHRDVKPGNLFLCPDEDAEHATRVLVLDFGIAQMTRADGTVTHFTRFGRGPLSPAYAAPEQLRGDEVLTPACDVFGLGAVAFELLAGRSPFGAAEQQRMADGLPVPAPSFAAAGADVPDALEAIVLRALSPDPDDRFADAAGFYAALCALPAVAPERAAAPAVVVDLEATPAAPPRRKPPAPSTVAAATRMTEAAPAATLLPCPDCGRAISRLAPACPQCGRPFAPAATGAPAKRKGGIGRMVLAVAAVLVLAFAGSLGMYASGVPLLLAGGDSARADTTGTVAEDTTPPEPVYVPAPRWEVGNVTSDEGCGDFFDVCRRVQCTVRNAGDAAGAIGVEARITGEEVRTRQKLLDLGPGEERFLIFEFPEVRAGELYEQATCYTVPADEVVLETPDEVATDTINGEI